jgi:TATA element modulatory factor
MEVNSRSSSTNRTNDRLQARLAKAMAAKNATAAPGDNLTVASPRSSTDIGSRSSMERPSMERPSVDKDGRLTAKDLAEPAPSVTSQPGAAVPMTPPSSTKEDELSKDKPAEVSSLTPAATDGSTVDESTRATETAATPDLEQQYTQKPQAASQQTENPVTEASDASKVFLQEEIQEYLERIDSLQSKLQYLSRTAAESAKKTAAAAQPGSQERKLAEKDEKIALLMEEGQKLSNTEQKFRTSIRKLRQQMADQEKQVEEQKKAKDRAVAEVEALKGRLNGSDEKEKRQEEARKATAALQRDIDNLRKEMAAKDEAMRRFELDLKAKAEKTEVANAEAHAQALTAERQKQKELEDVISAMKAENESLIDKARLDGLEWSEKLERAMERNRSLEEESKHEIRSLEAKLEAVRAAAEEVSSGSGGEAQIKLVRQIETLQSQYSTASDNWQGIEASLLAKVAGLEKERDEAQRRESEMRKKARDAVSVQPRSHDITRARCYSLVHGF